MSRIGRKPIPLPKGVEIKIQNDSVTVRETKGTLSFDILPNIEVSLDEGRIVVKRANDDKNVRAAHGMTRAVINNMVQGVSTGFERVLEIIGVGYRAQMQGKNLVLSVDYSHPIEVVPPSGIEFAVDGPTKIIVRGIDLPVRVRLRPGHRVARLVDVEGPVHLGRIHDMDVIIPPSTSALRSL